MEIEEEFISSHDSSPTQLAFTRFSTYLIVLLILFVSYRLIALTTSFGYRLWNIYLIRKKRNSQLI